MRENKAFMVFLVAFAMFVGSLSGIPAGSVCLWAADPVKADTPAPQASNVGYLENIVLENPMPGKERIIISVSRLSGASVESQTGNTLLVKLENTFVPQDFRRPLGEGALGNILRVVPAQKVLEGKQWAYVTVDLRERVPHSVRQEGQNVLIDFNVAGLAEKTVAALRKPAMSPAETPVGAEGQKDKTTGSEPVAEIKNYAGSRISLDFQDAGIKGVLRLLSELAEVNIVSGDDVKGNVTIQMKNVPWDQALDTILSITGLGKKQEGNVITVMTLEKMKKSEDDRAALEKAKKDEADRIALEKRKKEEADQLREPLITQVVPVAYNDPEELKKNVEELLKSKDDKDSKDPKDPKQPTDSKAASSPGSVTIDKHTRSLIIKATRTDMDSLLRFIERIDKPTAQILIKANIIQTTKTTARNLGIQWGGMYGQKIGDQGLYITPGGTGTATGTPFSGSYTPTTGAKGISGQGFGVNFPGIGAGMGGSLGLLYGTIGSNILDLQLNALQIDGKVNILSSPSLITLDNQKAFTESGQKIPFATLETTGGSVTKTIKFENAVLRLEITPHVIDGKSLKMKIMVQKDEIGASSVGDNPIINKRQTETSLIAQDGETIVISGLTEQKKNDATSGVPWLKDIPVLGWLFKGESLSDTKDEVLIFITPNILKPQTVAGIQEGPL